MSSQQILIYNEMCLLEVLCFLEVDMNYLQTRLCELNLSTTNSDSRVRRDSLLQDHSSGNQLPESRQSCLPARNDRCNLYV